MIKWSYCTTDIPEHSDLVSLARVINYNKRRMWEVREEPMGNGYEDPFSAQEAINKYITCIDVLSSEYRYMAMMFIGGRTA